VSGCSSGSQTLLRAAAVLARALARAAASQAEAGARPAAGQVSAAPEPATLVLTVPEAGSLGLRLIGGGRLSQAVAAVARGEADTVVVLDNDLSRRTPALLVDDLLRRRPGIIALATLEDRVVAGADVVLPAATVAEETGTFVNHEGRAQRYFAVLPPSGDVRPAWRWVRALLDRLGRNDGRGWDTVDDVIAGLEHDLPLLRGVATAAPDASWRADGRKVARQPLRATGRTAVDAARTVREPALADDPDSALAFSLEGLAPLQSPAALRARSWAPGWNSGNGLHKFDQELAATRPALPSGTRLLDGPPRRVAAAAPAAPPPFTPRLDEFTLVAVHRIFGSDDLSLYSPGVAARAAAPSLALNPADADRLGARDGDTLELWLPWMSTSLPCQIMASLVAGTAGVPLGVPGVPYISLPARGRITRLEAPA
jgi:NADH-quinone oxidoreductase subunit G